MFFVINRPRTIPIPRVFSSQSHIPETEILWTGCPYAVRVVSLTAHDEFVGIVNHFRLVHNPPHTPWPRGGDGAILGRVGGWESCLSPPQVLM
jgi:hypothetical protein